MELSKHINDDPHIVSSLGLITFYSTICNQDFQNKNSIVRKVETVCSADHLSFTIASYLRLHNASTLFA